MSAYPDALPRHLAKQRVEAGTIAPFVYWVDENQHTVERQKFVSDRVRDVVLVDDRPRVDADIGQRRRYCLEPARFERRAAPFRLATAPHDANCTELAVFCSHRGPHQAVTKNEA